MKIYILLISVLSVYILGCGLLFHKNYPNTENIKYKTRYFLNDKFACDLPYNGSFNARYNLANIKLYTRWGGLMIGDHTVSEISVVKWNNDSNILNKLCVWSENINNKYDCVEKKRNLNFSFSKGNNIVFFLTTLIYKDYEDNPELSKRFEIDDKIFARIVESIRVKNDKGEWVKPEIEKLSSAPEGFYKNSSSNSSSE